MNTTLVLSSNTLNTTGIILLTIVMAGNVLRLISDNIPMCKNLKCSRTAHIRKQVLVALTILINKCDSWNGLSCFAHDSLLPLAHRLFSVSYYIPT